MGASVSDSQADNTASDTAIARLNLVEYIFTTLLNARKKGFVNDTWEVTNINDNNVVKLLLIPNGSIAKCKLFVSRDKTATIVINKRSYNITLTDAGCDGVTTTQEIANADKIVDSKLQEIKAMAENNGLREDAYPIYKRIPMPSEEIKTSYRKDAATPTQTSRRAQHCYEPGYKTIEIHDVYYDLRRSY